MNGRIEWRALVHIGLNFDTVMFAGTLVILGHSSSALVACVLMEWGQCVKMAQ